jgi:regulatory protein
MTKAFDCAVRLLARREHGMRELLDKLVHKGYSLADSDEAVAECQRLGYQSDERYVELICSSRLRQGYGPVRITQELQSKRIDRDLITQVLSQQEGQWVEYGYQVWQKKFKNTGSTGYAEMQQQQRFLLYRGFSADTIAKIFAYAKTTVSSHHTSNALEEKSDLSAG